MTIYFVEGNIGTGKSTFLSLIEKSRPNSQVIYEPVDIWTSLKDEDGCNILQHFYNDPKRYAYAFQSLAFISRLEKLAEIEKDKDVFIERSIWSDSNVFARNCFMQGTLTDIEYKLYKRWFSWAETLVNNQVKGFKHIYLRCSPETSFERINKRNRTEESKIPIEYIKQIHDRHEEWLVGRDPGAIVVDVTSDRYLTDISEFDRILEDINAFDRSLENF